MMRRLATRDAIGGLLVIATGAAFGVSALDLGIGSLISMQSGYFPLVVAILTVFLGAVILARSLAAGGAEAEPQAGDGGGQPIAWRASIAVLGGVAMFALCMAKLGFIPAVFACSLLSAFADRKSRPLQALVLAAATAGACWLVFIYGLGIPAPAFRGIL